MSLLNKSNTKTSSRSQIAIKEVRDGILILPNNQHQAILETSSVNFELKSDAEQDVLIDNFQNFLNSLPCSLQILIRTRELDLDDYLSQISQTKNTETEDIYKQQLDHYSQFVTELVSGNKILTRRFYIVIPFTPEHSNSDFRLVKAQLDHTRDLVSKNLEKLGLRSRPLDSLEILNLFYSFYNPSHIKTQALKGNTIQTLLNHPYA